jgi:quinol monooxygenase YgiN
MVARLEGIERRRSMENKKVTVVARVKVKKGMEEKVKQELMSLVGPTRSEKGCISYDLHQSAEDKSRFMFYENWVSKKDLDQHLAMPYMKSHMEKANEFFAEPPEITLWEKI